MASISCQHIYKIYPGATAPSVTDFNLEIQDKEFIIFVGPLWLRQVHHPAHDRRSGGDLPRAKCTSAAA